MKELSLLLLALGLYLAGSAHAQSSGERGKLIGNALKSTLEKKYPFIKMEYFRGGKDKLLGNI